MNKKATQTLIESEVSTNWQPRWVVETPTGSKIGLVLDDHCFVVLSPNSCGQWNSIKHIPKSVARLIGQLCNEGFLDY